MGEQPTSRPSSGGKRAPLPLPKAHQSAEVAQRLLKHANYIPVKRFDSADYFLQQWEAKQQQQRRADEDAEAQTEQQHTPMERPSSSGPPPSTTATTGAELLPPPHPMRLSGLRPLSQERDGS